MSYIEPVGIDRFVKVAITKALWRSGTGLRRLASATTATKLARSENTRKTRQVLMANILKLIRFLSALNATAKGLTNHGRLT